MANKYIKLFIVLVFSLFNANLFPAEAAFRFVSWSDSQAGINNLPQTSNQAATLNPHFTIFNGDLEEDGATVTELNAQKTAINGGTGQNNGMFNKTFFVRGNHDYFYPDRATSGGVWSNYMNFTTVAQAVGATNYTELVNDLTYSFDYQNARFINFDEVGDYDEMTTAEINWLDQRLTDAETNHPEIQHAFLFWHSPIYCSANHCSCTSATDANCTPTALINLINKHPLVSATFHGHEHVLTWTHVGKSRLTSLTNEWEQFSTSPSGESTDNSSIRTSRVDYANTANTRGFATIDVDGLNFTVNFYRVTATNPVWTKQFTKNSNPASPSPSSQPSPSPSPSPSTNPGLQGDANNDGKVDGIDYVIWLNHYGQTISGNNNGDFNGDNKVDGIDYVIWLNHYGQTASPSPSPTTGSFNFISWSDTETSLSTLASLSNQALALQPEFTLYNGDAEGGQGLNGWQNYLNGNNNGLANKTFVVRGNGNSGDSNWSTFFNFSQVAANVGATNYTSLTTNQTYSFDYANSRFIGVDILGCANLISSNQISWISGRITDAETKGLTHVFLFMHGPIWYVNNHTECTVPANLVSLISAHPIVTASFHGHEHTKSFIPFGLNDSRLTMAHSYYQIVSGGAGGGTYPCNAAHHTGANDYCNKFEGFANIIVNGNNLTLSFYQNGNTTPVKTINFSK